MLFEFLTECASSRTRRRESFRPEKVMVALSAATGTSRDGREKGGLGPRPDAGMFQIRLSGHLEPNGRDQRIIKTTRLWPRLLSVVPS